MRRIALAATLPALIAGLLVAAGPARAATGLDPTYGDEGVATVLVPDPYDGELEPLASFFGDVDELGRVVRGSLGTGQIVRLDANGVPDASFGGGDGIADVGGHLVDASEDGIVVAGWEAADGVVRLDDDGSIADWWGVDGHASLTAPGAGVDSKIVNVDLAPDGSVYAMVDADSTPSVSVHRLLPDGTVDEAFGVDGSVVRSAADLRVRIFEALDADNSGVVFARNHQGEPDVWDEQETVVVERLGTDGLPHPKFGVDGAVELQGGALAVDIDERDGTIFVGGAGIGGAKVWHLDWNGRLDRRFAAGLRMPDGPHVVFDLEALGDGRVAAALESGDGSHLIVLRPDGTGDPGFGPDGVQVAPGKVPTGGAVGVDQDDRVIAWTRLGNATGVPEQARAYLTDFAGLAPTVTAVTPYESSLSVTWEAPEATSAHPVRIWHLRALDSEANVVGQTVVAGDVRQASIEGLDPVQEHHLVLVTPYDDFGPGITSPFLAAEADPSALPAGTASVVRGVEAAAGNGHATVTWDPPTDDGGATIWGFSVIAVRKSDGALVAWRNVRADVRSAAVPGLANGAAVDVYVVAVTTKGFGAVGSPVVVTPTTAGAAVAAPQMGWVAVVPTGSSAVVSWGPPTERGEVAQAVHVIVLEDGAMTQWKAMTALDRQVVVPASTGALIYVVAQSASGFGPLTGPITVTP